MNIWRQESQVFHEVGWRASFMLLAASRAKASRSCLFITAYPLILETSDKQLHKINYSLIKTYFIRLLTSFAKKAASFFNISRPIRNCSTSLRNLPDFQRKYNTQVPSSLLSGQA